MPITAAAAIVRSSNAGVAGAAETDSVVVDGDSGAGSASGVAEGPGTFEGETVTDGAGFEGEED